MKLQKGQLVKIDWDDPKRYKSAQNGSYHGIARFVREVRKGTRGDEMLLDGPHIVVRCGKDNFGSFFPLSAVSLPNVESERDGEMAQDVPKHDL